MTYERLRAAIDHLTEAIEHIGTATSKVQEAADVLAGVIGDGGGAEPERVLFASPVTGVVGEVWGKSGKLSWWDATGWAVYYTATGKGAYHTGADLNLEGLQDAGKPVYAVCDGEVVYAGAVTGWQGQVVCLKHVLEDGSFVWTRYAHITAFVTRGNHVLRGTPIGKIADYNKDGPKGDHLHYDVAKIDLGMNPGDWPGLDKAGLVRDYIDPAKWHMDRAA